jgi:hypothetical protein
MPAKKKHPAVDLNIFCNYLYKVPGTVQYNVKMNFSNNVPVPQYFSFDQAFK